MGHRITIVNENDEVIGAKERSEITSADIYRVAALWITNSKGEILLARRALSKRHDPGKWGPAVAGTVDEGETYLQNIVKEAEEEIGLKNISPTVAHKYRVTGKHQYFGQWFTLVLDTSIDRLALDPKEVAEVRWYTKAELLAELQRNPEIFLGRMQSWAEMFSR